MQMIYEYSMRVPLPLNLLQENFTRSIPSLAHILNAATPEENDELNKLMIYQSIEEFFIGQQGAHLPSIQLCNVSNKI